MPNLMAGPFWEGWAVSGAVPAEVLRWKREAGCVQAGFETAGQRRNREEASIAWPL